MPQTDQSLNQQIIQDFHANDGQIVSGPFKGAPLLLLHTRGAKSGMERVTPMTYLSDENRLFVFASDSGEPGHPGWYYNLLAHPEATIELGMETFDVRAIVLQGEERDTFFAKQAAIFPQFIEYQKKAKTRLIPVIELIRKSE